MFRPSSGPSERTERTEKAERALSPQAAAEAIAALTAERDVLAGKLGTLQQQAEQSAALQDAKQRAEKSLEDLRKAKTTAERRGEQQAAVLQQALVAESSALLTYKTEARRKLKDLEGRNAALAKEAKALAKELAALQRAKATADRKAEEALDGARRALMLAIAGNPHSRQNEEELRRATDGLVAAVEAAAAKKVAALDADLQTIRQALAAEEQTSAQLRKAKAAADAGTKALEDRLLAAQAEHATDVAAANRRVDDAARRAQKAEDALREAHALWTDQAAARDDRHERDLTALQTRLEAAHRAALDAQAGGLDREKHKLVEAFVGEHTAALRALETQHAKDVALLRSESDSQLDEVIDDYEAKIRLLKEKLLELARDPRLVQKPTRPPPEPPQPPAENRRASS